MHTVCCTTKWLLNCWQQELLTVKVQDSTQQRFSCWLRHPLFCFRFPVTLWHDDTFEVSVSQQPIACVVGRAPRTHRKSGVYASQWASEREGKRERALCPSLKKLDDVLQSTLHYAAIQPPHSSKTARESVKRERQLISEAFLDHNVIYTYDSTCRFCE